MSVFDIIDSVDWNKNIIFLILYVTIVVMSVFVYLVPLMDNYKSVIMEYRKTNILDNQINATLDNIKGNEDNILRENIAVFERLAHKADIGTIQKYARTYIKGAKVEDLGVAEAENGITIHSFKITGQTRNLANVKNLLANISTLQNSVRIAFPIVLAKDEKRRILNAEISIMIYNTSRDISKVRAIGEENLEVEATPKAKDSAKSAPKNAPKNAEIAQ